MQAMILAYGKVYFAATMEEEGGAAGRLGSIQGQSAALLVVQEGTAVKEEPGRIRLLGLMSGGRPRLLGSTQDLKTTSLRIQQRPAVYVP